LDRSSLAQFLPPDIPGMTIGFDISQTGKSKAGCGYFADGLIRQLAASDTRNQYVLYPAAGDLFWDPECDTSTFSCSRPNFRRLSVPPDFEASREFWRNRDSALERRLGNPDIIHMNNFFCPTGLKEARLVYTLYDLSFLEDPCWTTEQNRIGCFQGVFQASLHADFIVAISEYTRRHFLSLFIHFPPERVAVIHPASRFDARIQECKPERFSALESDRFWLSVGTLEPRKNHARLLDAYRIHKTKYDQALPLVLAGGQGWMMNHFETLFQGLELGREVILPGYVSDAELGWLFQNCFGFIYPSLFEGFGMPVLEALSLGAPVLCSDTTSLPEAAGKAAVYFDPSDPHSIAGAMNRLARGELDRESLISAGIEHAKGFSWAISAARLSEVYRQVMEFPRIAPRGSVTAAVAADS
jgi:glycosyltransferase involved in cell wall biosynthesis